MATPEGRVKAAVKKLLAEFGSDVYRFMPVQAGFGDTTLDFLCAINGRFFAIETKAPGKTTTPRQQNTIRQITAAGGVCFVIDNTTPMALQPLRDFLEEVSATSSSKSQT